MIYYHGGTPVATTTNIDRMARTAQEMTEAQRDSYEALTENLATSQRRTVGLANDGLKFFRLQQSNVRAAQEWFANGVRLMQLQQMPARWAQCRRRRTNIPDRRAHAGNTQRWRSGRCAARCSATWCRTGGRPSRGAAASSSTQNPAFSRGRQAKRPPRG